MIQAKVHNQDDEEIVSLWLREVPRVGEILWLSGGTRAKTLNEHGTTSFKVNTVCHWVSDAWQPNTHAGEPIHTVCLYVESVKD